MEGKESLVPAFAIKVSTGPGRAYEKRCFFQCFREVSSEYTRRPGEACIEEHSF